MNKDKSILSVRINEMRKELNLTQEELALKLGLKGKSSIANYESSKITPSDDIKLRMCEIFDCTLDYLMGKSNYKTAFDEFMNLSPSSISLKDFGNRDYLNKEQFVLDTAYLYNQLQSNEASCNFSEDTKLRIYQLYNGFLSIPKTKKLIEDYNLHPEKYQYTDEIYHDNSNTPDYIDVFDAFNFNLTLYERNFILDCIPNESFNEKVKYLDIEEDRKKYIFECYNKILDFVNFLQEHSEETLKPIKELSNIEDIVNYKQTLKKFGISKENLSNYFMCPVYGQISAGQPNWAEECIEGRLPIDPNLMGIINPEEHYFLRVNGESMNKVVKNGAFALIHKQDAVENGEIAVVLVNGYDATLKKFTKQGDLVILEPQSDDESFKTQVYDKNTIIKVLGKYVGKMEFNK